MKRLVLLLLSSCVAYREQPLQPEASAQAFLARDLATPELREFFATHHRELPAGEWSFADLWLAALCYQPALAAARARLLVTAAEIEKAGIWPNPTLAFLPEWSANPDPGISPWVLGFTLTFPIELGGKRAARQQLAEQVHRAEGFATAGTLWHAREALQLACIQRVFAQQRRELAGQEVAIRSRAVQLLEHRFAAGAASASEVATARIEARQAEAEVLSADSDVLQTQHELAQAIGVPAQALADVRLPATTLRLPELSPRPFGELQRAGLHARDDVLQHLADYEVKEAALRLEVGKQYPDLQLGPGYQYDQGQDKFAFGFTFELPLFDHNAAGIAAAVAARTLAAAEFQSVQARAIGELELAFAAEAQARTQTEALARTQAELTQRAEMTDRRVAAGADDALAAALTRVAEAVGARALFAAREQNARKRLALEEAVGLPLTTLQAEADSTVLQQGDGK